MKKSVLVLERLASTRAGKDEDPSPGAHLDRLRYDQKTQRAHSERTASRFTRRKPETKKRSGRVSAGFGGCDGQLQILKDFISLAPASRSHYLQRLLDFMLVLHNWLQQQHKNHFLHQRTVAWGANNRVVLCGRTDMGASVEGDDRPGCSFLDICIPAKEAASEDLTSPRLTMFTWTTVVLYCIL